MMTQDPSDPEVAEHVGFTEKLFEAEHLPYISIGPILSRTATGHFG